MFSEYGRLLLIDIDQFNFPLNSASQRNVEGHVQRLTGFELINLIHRMVRENFWRIPQVDLKGVDCTKMTEHNRLAYKQSKGQMKVISRRSYCYADATRHTKQSKQRTPKLLWNKDCLAARSFSSRALYMAVTFDRCEHVRQGGYFGAVILNDKAEVKHETVNELENAQPSGIWHTL